MSSSTTPPVAASRSWAAVADWKPVAAVLPPSSIASVPASKARLPVTIVRPAVPTSPGATVAWLPTRMVPWAVPVPDVILVASIAPAASVPPLNANRPFVADPLAIVPATTSRPPSSESRPDEPVAEAMITLPATRSPPAVTASVGDWPATTAAASRTVPACWPTASTATVPELICTVSNLDGCQFVSQLEEIA